jgi:cell shape-determining protein MreC
MSCKIGIREKILIYNKMLKKLIQYKNKNYKLKEILNLNCEII